MADIEALNHFIYTDVAFPVSTQELIEHAKRNHLSHEIINALNKLPNREFSEPMDVLHTLVL